MIEVYLFDWGDTLMVDFAGADGKMCDWEVVEAVDGARETLQQLSKKARIYVATGATDSTESEIKKAFERVNLSHFISDYFCAANLGIPKGTPEFLPAILNILNTPAAAVAMVGDSLSKDIQPAAAVGIKSIWLSKTIDSCAPEGAQIIGDLRELCR